MEEDKSIGTIIYLVCWPITQWEVDNWGITYLKSEGFDIQVYDLTFLIRNKAIFKNPVDSKIRDAYIHEIASYKELNIKLQGIPDNTIFLDYIVSISDITFQTAKLFKILKKFNISYCSVYSGTVPQQVKINDTSTKVNKIIKRAKKALDWNTLKDYISGRVNRLLVKYTDIYPLPNKLFSTIESEAVRQYIKNYARMKDGLVPINAYDYDNYLKYINTDHQIKFTEKICVFLDEAATHHSDYAILGLKPLGEDTYYNTMNRLFDNIELKTKLRVIIAAHPKSKYEEMPEAFGGREIIKGKTMELVSQSSLVVMHFSTSVSFAVLFKKPIMVVKTKEMVAAGWYAEGVDIMAESLGLAAINIDDIDLNTLDFNYNEWDKTQYDNYAKKYLISEDSAGFTTREIVAKELKDMLSNESN